MARKTNKPEKREEAKFVKAVHQMGGICEKQQMFGAYGRVGFSDRLTILPRCTIFFVEFKRPKSEGGIVSEHQKRRHRHLKRLGVPTYVAQSYRKAMKIAKRHLKEAGVSWKRYPLWNKKIAH